MEEDNQGNDDIVEFNEGICLEPCDYIYSAEDNVPLNSTSKYGNSEETQQEEGSFVSFRSHRRLMKAKDVIIEELELQVDQLENRNMSLHFQKQKLEKEVSKLREDAEVQIVREVIRKQTPVSKVRQSVSGVSEKAEPKQSNKIWGSATSNTVSQKNICTADTAKLSEPKHSARVARPHLKHFECICGKLCKSSSNCNYHINAKKTKSVFRCDFCTKRYTSHANLNLHLMKMHNVIPAEQVACLACGSMFNSRKEMREHRRIVHSKQPNTSKA